MHGIRWARWNELVVKPVVPHGLGRVAHDVERAPAVDGANAQPLVGACRRVAADVAVLRALPHDVVFNGAVGHGVGDADVPGRVVILRHVARHQLRWRDRDGVGDVQAHDAALCSGMPSTSQRRKSCSSRVCSSAMAAACARASSRSCLTSAASASARSLSPARS